MRECGSEGKVPNSGVAGRSRERLEVGEELILTSMEPFAFGAKPECALPNELFRLVSECGEGKDEGELE